MALSPEDKKDVKTHMGKALANKVSTATRDHVPKKAPSWSQIMKSAPNLQRDSKGNVSGKKFKQEQRSVPPSDMARHYLGRK